MRNKTQQSCREEIREQTTQARKVAGKVQREVNITTVGGLSRLRAGGED